MPENNLEHHFHEDSRTDALTESLARLVVATCAIDEADSEQKEKARLNQRDAALSTRDEGATWQQIAFAAGLQTASGAHKRWAKYLPDNDI